MATVNFNIQNAPHSGVASSNIFVSIFGTDPITQKFCYYDFSTNSLQPYSSYKSGVTSCMLASITAPIPVPAIKSARIYFAINNDFTSMADSGPSISKTEPIMYDKIEFDTSTTGYYNINSTNVDFYAFSYTMSVKDNSGKTVTVGLTSSRTKVFGDLKAIPKGSAAGVPGNTAMYAHLFATDGNNITRFIAPKSAGFSDWGTNDNAQLFTHYLDTYVNNECFKKNRKFSFYSKFYPNSPVFYGQVSADGLLMKIYTDKEMKHLQCTLHRPSSAFGNPDFKKHPTYFHQTSGTDNTAIDWGFMLIGNVNGSGLAANWGIDPAAMGVLVSICRGVAHLDNGCTDWVNSKLYYQGLKGKSTENFPIEYYSKIIHDNAPNGAAYALSYDDVYGQNSSVGFDSGATVTISLNSLEAVPNS